MKKHMQRLTSIALSVIMALTLVLSLAGCGGGGVGSQGISVADLFAEFEKNPTAASEKYKDQEITVTGIVYNISGTDVSLAREKTSFTNRLVECSFLTTKEEVMNLSVDETITITGTFRRATIITGFNAIYLDKCYVGTSKSQSGSSAAEATPAAATSAPAANAPATNVSSKKLVNAKPFSEGFAWVAYQDSSLATGTTKDSKPNNQVTSLINTSGDIVYTETEPVEFFFPVKDGKALLVLTAAQKRGTTPAYDCKVVDTEGKVLYSNVGTGTESDSVYVLDTSGENLLVCRAVANINEKSVSIGVIDTSDKQVKDWVLMKNSEIAYFLRDAYSDHPIGKLADDLFVISGSLYDADKNTLSSIYSSFTLLGYEKGIGYVAGYDGIYAIPRASLSAQLAKDGYRDLDESLLVITNNNTDTSKASGSDDCLKLDKTYYDLQGKKLFALDSSSTYAAGNMSGGLARVVIKGADSKYYLTMVDKTGKQLFEPIVYDGDNNNGSTNVSEDYIAAVKNKELVTIDKQGVVTKLETPSYFSFHPVSDGYVMTLNQQNSTTSYCFQSVTGDTKIGTL